MLLTKEFLIFNLNIELREYKYMFTLEDVEKVIQKLSNDKRIFVSEADLQVSFIIEASKTIEKEFYYYPEFSPSSDEVPKEYKDNFGGKVNFDLLIIDKETNDKTIIEFKYKTKELSNYQTNRDGMPVYINKGGNDAPDLGRYDCWKDIYRIEQFVKSKYCKKGFFIFITDVEAYLTNPEDKYYKDFDMSKGQHSPNQNGKYWKQRNNHISSIGKERDHPLKINNLYEFEYKTFLEEFTTGKKTKHNFKYLIVKIEK